MITNYYFNFVMPSTHHAALPSITDEFRKSFYWCSCGKHVGPHYFYKHVGKPFIRGTY
jgi:hypothetical protein